MIRMQTVAMIMVHSNVNVWMDFQEMGRFVRTLMNVLMTILTPVVNLLIV